MPLNAFDACLASGLQRGEVTAASCRVSADRQQFTLSLDCTITESRARELAASFLESRPRVSELLIETPHGSWRWSESRLEEHAGKIPAGVRFVVSPVERIPEYSDFYERCLSAFRVRIQEQWDHHGEGLEAIRILEGLESIRRRPEMYLRSPLDANRLFEIVLEQAVVGWLAGTTRDIAISVSASGTSTVKDDGVPFSFAIRPDGVSWAHHFVGRLAMAIQQWRREDDRARRDYTFVPPQVALANALSSTFSVESCEGNRAHRQRYVKGRPLEPETIAPWPADGTSITFTPDPSLFDQPLDLVRVRASVERVACLCPGKRVLLHGEPVTFDSFLAALPRLQPTQAAWGGFVFEHTVERSDFVLRSAIGLSEHATGGLECFLNLSRMAFVEGDGFRGDHLDAVLATLADAVRLPGARCLPREKDLVGVLTASAGVSENRALPLQGCPCRFSSFGPTGARPQPGTQPAPLLPVERSEGVEP